MQKCLIIKKQFKFLRGFSALNVYFFSHDGFFIFPKTKFNDEKDMDCYLF